MTDQELHTYPVKVFLSQFNPKSERDIVKIDFFKRNTAEELIDIVLQQLENRAFNSPSSSTNKTNNFTSETKSKDDYELCEIMGTLDGQACKERKVDSNEYPVAIQLWWPKNMPVSQEECFHSFG